MTDAKGGIGAEVGARKVSDGEVVQAEGVARQTPPLWAYVVFWTLVVLSGFGIWQILELVHLV